MDRWILLTTYTIRKILFSGSVKSNGVILEDIVRQLGTTNSVVAWIFAIQNGICYLISPLAYLLLEIFNSRQLSIFGGVITGIAYILCGMFLNSVWQLMIYFIISGIGFGLLTLPMYLVLREYFGPTQLPKVLSFLALFDYVGVATVPSVMQYFRSKYGLNNSLILFGALLWNTVVSGVAAKPPRQSKSETEDKQKEETEESDSRSSNNNKWKKSCPYIPRLFYHNNVIILLVIEFVGYYVFMSWALFLFSLGKSLELSDEEAVFLTTAGGVGGLIGRLITFCLFQLDEVNPFSSSLIPLTVTGIAFVALSFCKNTYAIIIFVFISGLSQGINTSGVNSLGPTLVCGFHYKQMINIECVSTGIATQAAGLISGFIQDMTGYTIHVYLFNAVLCFASLPLAVWWACDQEPNLKC